MMDQMSLLVQDSGNSMQPVAKTIDDISAFGREIVKIIRRINKIAFQINPLTLNVTWRIRSIRIQNGVRIVF